MQTLMRLFPTGLLVGGIVAAAFVLGLYTGLLRVETEAAVGTVVLGSDKAPEGVDFTSLWKAWRILDQEFVATTASSTKPEAKERVWGAIQGLAESYGDPYTVFFPPEETERFEEDIRGNFEGVGMEIGNKDGVLVVVAPLSGSPAERAGMRSGDRILRIDGVLTDGMSVEAAVKRIRGPKGTAVVITIARGEKQEVKDVSITRDVIVIPSIATALRSDGIFVISLYNFSAVSPQRFREALREFIESGSTRLVLDLRGNPGGFLEVAVDMASFFLPLGTVVVIEDYAGKQEQDEFRSKGYDVFRSKKLSMAILVDEGSASASEILAGALREHGVATLIGKKTFGKGSVQQLVDLGDGATLKVTIAKWRTPNGISISEGGLAPDIEVDRTEKDFKEGKDPQMDAAVLYLTNH